LQWIPGKAGDAPITRNKNPLPRNTTREFLFPFADHTHTYVITHNKTTENSHVVQKSCETEKDLQNSGTNTPIKNRPVRTIQQKHPVEHALKGIRITPDHRQHHPMEKSHRPHTAIGVVSGKRTRLWMYHPVEESFLSVLWRAIART